MAKSAWRLPCRHAVSLAAMFAASGAHAAPPIRLSESNRVPACVTPERLMAFIADRNPGVDRRYANIAEFYKHYGEAWHVRWDYAFYQMILETNYLSYRKGDGHRGDVFESQNNFAGIGATGNGAHGERFQDIETGVHAQIQHLVAYSGERVQEPIARRTRENQDDIIAQSHRVRHQMTFGDLSRRWATDRAYGKSIDIVADLFMSNFCVPAAATAAEDAVPAPQPVNRLRFMPFRPPSGLGGPKPEDLAQPAPDSSDQEVLPWLAEPVKRPPTAHISKPSAPAKKAKALARAKAPVKAAAVPDTQIKTIWSRGNAGKPVPVAPAAPPVADDAPQRPRTAERNIESANDAKGNATSSANTDASAPGLPTFKITPVAVTASRLGGPIPPGDVIAPQAAAPPAEEHCRVLTASYGGNKTLLLKSSAGGETHLTALTVLDGFEKSLFENYANAEAKGAQIVGEYETVDAALADARVNCPDK